MNPASYGEDQPRLDDDRLPIVLIILDGLGDRALPELDGATPTEAAHTPHLDAAAAAGMTGWHLPFGWGRAPTSELSHWAMFGYSDVPFPGRAVLEALGAGLPVKPGTATLHAALRTSAIDGNRLLITGRAERGTDDEDAAQLLVELNGTLASHGMRLTSLGGRGEALLQIDGTGFAHVTDSDPFFETFHPWLRPLPTVPSRAPGGRSDAPGAGSDSDAAKTARRLSAALREARQHLIHSTVNQCRADAGRPPLDVLTTKWAGGRLDVPTFTQQHGVAGAAVTSTRLYRGFARLLEMDSIHVNPQTDLAADMASRLEQAGELIARGARFVHVHTKATDEAGHTKDPFAKRDVLEQIDAGLSGLAHLATGAVVAVTGDHATPSSHGVLHTADPTPFLVTGPSVRADPVTHCGERHTADGWLGQLQAHDIMPLLAGCANRPSLLGHRPWPRHTSFLPDEPEPMTIEGDR